MNFRFTYTPEDHDDVSIPVDIIDGPDDDTSLGPVYTVKADDGRTFKAFRDELDDGPIDTEEFISGYIHCGLWADAVPYCASEEERENIEFGGLEGETIADDVRGKVAEDCIAFIDYNLKDLALYCAERTYDAGQGSVSEYAGHDFCLTRGGHGAGFWDRGLGELGERLSEAARAYGSPLELWQDSDGIIQVG